MIFSMRHKYTFYEFFAGGGMARMGLGSNWQCLFANDFSEHKAESYRQNFPPADELKVDDVNNVNCDDLPFVPDLAWASFPCQDLSLAGDGAGLKGKRSGTFRPFWKIIKNLNRQGRKPKTIILENVFGTITSHGGNDFKTILNAVSKEGYQVGAAIIDAKYWVPQSRPRLFIIAVDQNIIIPESLKTAKLSELWHPKSLQRAVARLPSDISSSYVWFDIPQPARRNVEFSDLVEDHPTSVKWHDAGQTKRLLALMNDRHKEKVKNAKTRAQQTGRRQVGTVYKRTRNGEQRAEVRFDNIAGCLRTPRGGSSRQTIIVVDETSVASRLLSTREAARLMGIDDTYKLPDNYNQAYHLAGDGVVVPVVRHLAQNLIEPILKIQETPMMAAE